MNVMLIAGEASGDMHGANMIKALQQQHPDTHCFGIGGQAMRDAGLEQLYDANKIAVVGLVEVLKHFGDIRQAWHTAKQALMTRRPDVLILIDYPGFNLRFAKLAKQHGIKVLYYISPQIWAWHQSRVHKIKLCVDHMAVIFPFEVPFYQKAGVPVSFVGSPLVESTHKIGTQKKAQQALKLDAQHPVIGLLPGSRHSELSRILPTMIKTAEQIQQRHPKAQFLLPIANSLTTQDLEPYLRNTALPIKLLPGQAHAAIEAADAVVCTSGTATLETALIGTPMVIIYKTSPVTYWLAKRLIKLKHIGLCNIVADAAIVPELIQHDANPKNIADTVDTLLSPETNQSIRQKLQQQVANKLGQPGAAAKVAELAIKLAN